MQNFVVLKKYEDRQSCILLTHVYGKITARIKKSSSNKQLHSGVVAHGFIEKRGKYYYVDHIDLVACVHFASLQSMELFHDLVRLLLYVLPEQAVDDSIFLLAQHAVLYWQHMTILDQQLMLAKLFFLVDIFPDNVQSYQLVFASAEKDEGAVVSLLRSCWQLYEQR